MINALITGRYYRPLDDAARARMCRRAGVITGQDASYYAANPSRLFPTAYEFAKAVPESMARMEQFRNLYGLTRNLAFIGFLAAAIFSGRALATGDQGHRGWAAFALVGGLVLLIRFLKFYGAFASEITRCFAYCYSAEVRAPPDST